MTEFVLVSGSKEAFCAKMAESVKEHRNQNYDVHYFEPRADSFNGYEWYSAIIEFYDPFYPSEPPSAPAESADHPVTPPDNYYWDHVVD